MNKRNQFEDTKRVEITNEMDAQQIKYGNNNRCKIINKIEDALAQFDLFLSRTVVTYALLRLLMIILLK